MGTPAKHQFLMLDGLRGVAALSVVVFHQRVWLGGGDAMVGHAFLSVDFFFMLSGFVLAHAYEQRLREPGSLGPFLRDRVIRLHPALVAGAVLAFLGTALRESQGHVALLAYWPLTLVASFVPFPAVWNGSTEAFPWNLAVWSLFWEIVANIIFAVGARRLTDRVLIAIVAVSAVTMIAASQAYNGFQTGFRTDWASLSLGLPRVCLSFFAGVLLLRLHHRLPFARAWRGGEWTALCLVALLAAVPTGAKISAIYDPLVVILVFPPLLLAAARSRPSVGWWAAATGAVSYPLYVLHLPLLVLLDGVIVRIGLTGPRELAYAGAAALAAAVLLSYAALRFYDEPARTWLRARFGSRRHRAPAADDRAAGPGPESA